MSTQTEAPAAPRGSRIRAAWRGEAPLSWAFWGFYFGGGILFWALGAFGFLFLIPFTVRENGSALESPLFRTYLLFLLVAYILYVAASMVMVWRCSPNTSSRVWGYIARGIMVLWLLRLLFAFRTLIIG